MKSKMVLLLSIVALLGSCKKENVVNDFELNRQIDQRIADGILIFSPSEREAIFYEKQVILTRIIQANPKITFQELYPKKPKSEYLSKEECVTNYSAAMTNCNVAMAVSCFVSVCAAIGTGIATGIASAPLGGIPGVITGVGTGAALLTASGYSYWNCSVNAAAAYKTCQGYK